jgi:hypothetical protein
MKLSIDDTALILWEMTWLGYDEQSVQQRLRYGKKADRPRASDQACSKNH